MARWSDCIKLSQYEEFRSELIGPGVYEIGNIVNNSFFPKYLGEGQNIYIRIRSYQVDGVCHNPSIREKIEGRSNRLWFHYFRTSQHEAVEARLLLRHGIGRDAGLYKWNKRYEKEVLRKLGWLPEHFTR